MPAMTATVAAVANATRRHPNPSPAQTFNPKYPLNPFGDDTGADLMQFIREPWKLYVDAIPPLHVTNQRRSVVLIIGEPQTQHYLPLFRSPHLASSLLIIASYNPLRLPPIIIPTVRILRLKQPLAVENAGAERLVRTLEWAERVSRLWRTYGGSGVCELLEPGDEKRGMNPLGNPGGAPIQRPRSFFGLDGPESEYSQLDSTTNLNQPAPFSLPRRPLRSKTLLAEPPQTLPRSLSYVSSLDFTPSKQRLNKTLRPNTLLPPENPTQRSFDVLLNFLPPSCYSGGNPNGVPDGLILKNAILVTTVSRPFLIANTPMSIYDKKETRRRSQSLYPSQKPHLGRPVSKGRWSMFRQPQLQSQSQTQLSAPSPPELDPSSRIRIRASQTLPPTSFPILNKNSILQSLSTPLSPATSSLIIHVLPTPPHHLHPYSSSIGTYTDEKSVIDRFKLIRSLESFLGAFGSAQSLPSSPSRASYIDSEKGKEKEKGGYGYVSGQWGEERRAYAIGPIDRARPYLVDAGSFVNDVMSMEVPSSPASVAEGVSGAGAPEESEGEWSLADLILCGCLDADPRPALSGRRRATSSVERVWVSGISDIVLTSSPPILVGNEAPSPNVSFPSKIPANEDPNLMVQPRSNGVQPYPSSQNTSSNSIPAASPVAPNSGSTSASASSHNVNAGLPRTNADLGGNNQSTFRVQALSDEIIYPPPPLAKNLAARSQFKLGSQKNSSNANGIVGSTPMILSPTEEGRKKWKFWK